MTQIIVIQEIIKQATNFRSKYGTKKVYNFLTNMFDEIIRVRSLYFSFAMTPFSFCFVLKKVALVATKEAVKQIYYYGF